MGLLWCSYAGTKVAVSTLRSHIQHRLLNAAINLPTNLAASEREKVLALIGNRYNSHILFKPPFSYTHFILATFFAVCGVGLLWCGYVGAEMAVSTLRSHIHHRLLNAAINLPTNLAASEREKAPPPIGNPRIPQVVSIPEWRAGRAWHTKGLHL